MTRANGSHKRSPRRIAIVGGGISGLATAFFLSKSFTSSEAEIILFESSSVWGGVIHSELARDFLWEGGPDSFVSHKPEAVDLCRQLGLEDDLVQTPVRHRRAYIFSGEKFYALPLLTPSSLLKTPLLSWKGRLRVVLEPLVGASGLDDESVSDFVVRRLGREVLDKIVEPLVSGIYGGNSRQLSIRSTLPLLYQGERPRSGFSKSCLQMLDILKVPEFGETRESLFSLKKGMSVFVRTLVEKLRDRVDMRLQTPVSEVMQVGGRFQVWAGGEAEDFDTVTLATPASSAVQLISSSFPQVADLLQTVPYMSAVVVAFGYDQAVLADRVGTGFLIPPSEGKVMSACTWVNQKFPGRCPEGYGMLRCFIGREEAGRWMSSDDEELVGQMKSELKDILGVTQEPISRKIYRWQTALPQYRLGHHSRIKQLYCELESLPGLHLAGNFLDGVGIADCIRHAQRVSELMKEN